MKIVARRTATISLIVGVFSFATYYLYSSRIARLDVAREQLLYYQELHEEMIMQHSFFGSEITKLMDEDYIAMLARGQYFKSLPGEIIFRISDVEEDEEVEDTNDDVDAYSDEESE